MRRIILFAAICVVVGTPALADLVVEYDLNNANLDFTRTTNKLLVTPTTGSDLWLYLTDSDTLTSLDEVKVSSGNFAFLLDLQMTDLAGDNNWSAAGELKFSDSDITSSAVMATFQSQSIAINTVGSLHYLEIVGHLNTYGANTSILVNRGDPWVFAGDGGTAGVDGTANQITVFNSLSYDNGMLLTLKFGVSSTLDNLFSMDRILAGGEVKGSIVPVPAAFLLGFLGLGAAGLKLRRFA